MITLLYLLVLVANENSSLKFDDQNLYFLSAERFE